MLESSEAVELEQACKQLKGYLGQSSSDRPKLDAMVKGAARLIESNRSPCTPLISWQNVDWHSKGLQSPWVPDLSWLWDQHPLEAIHSLDLMGCIFAERSSVKQDSRKEAAGFEMKG